MWDPFTFVDSFFGNFMTIFIIISIVFVIIFVVVIFSVCRGGAGIARGVARGFTMDAPSFAIPDRYRGQTRSDGSEMTTVRLPEKCPSCGAGISQNEIDWTGPLEAKCNYCGGTLRAKFERV
ncbi:MAG: hypothetical protein E4H14_16240 [Candidatus Thorarchaeota archaeon]|nr:MAG: hypothetical protein E4H14_16240 [Candidatus Thorarchaeota archaeon]